MSELPVPDLFTEMYPYLSTVAGFKALAGDRLYPEVAPQDSELPYAVMSMVGEVSNQHMGGAVSLVLRSYQFDVYAEDSATRGTLTGVIRDALAGYRGNMGETYIHGSIHDNTFFTFDLTVAGSESGTFRSIMQFRIWHTASQPTQVVD